MEILKNPWKDVLLDLTHGAKHSIKMTSPFVKKNICEAIFEVKNASVNFELITSFKLQNCYAGALDLTALDFILDNGGIVRNHPKLHAKIYIFDDKKAIVTSGNLTNGGVINNFEYGLFLTEKEIVKQIVKDFGNLSIDEITGFVKREHILKSTEILSKILKEKSIKFPKMDFDNSAVDSGLFTEISNPIASSLSGWKLEVFRCLDTVPNQDFSLEEAYSFEGNLKLIFPQNKHINDKIRQQIQYLRDLGLIEFLSKGNYRKLW